MAEQVRKLSEILKEMSESLSLGIDVARAGHRKVWETIGADNPDLWNEFESNDTDAILDGLVRYKRAHYPDDRRRILTCGIPDGKIRVEWLPGADPGVDSQWEMTLYGLVRLGEKEQAIQFLRKTRRMTRNQASSRVASIAADLGMK